MDDRTKNYDTETQKIGFVGFNFVTKHLVNKLAETANVHVWTHSPPDTSLSKKINFHQHSLSWAGLREKFVQSGSQLTLPHYYKNLNKSLKKHPVDVLIVMDFIRIWYWQVLWYGYKNPNVKIILLTETKHKPSSLVGKIGFWVFIWVATLTQKRLHQILTYHPDGTQYLKKFLTRTPITHFVFPVSEETPLYQTPTPGESIRILVPARLVPFKRHIDVIEAMKQVPSTKNIQIDFASFVGLNNSPLENTLRKDIEQSGLTKKITIIPPIPQPFSNYYKLLKDYDVVLLPSENEAVGAVVPAALRSGRACITSDTVGANTFMKDGHTGYIFPTKDTGALSKVLIELDKSTIHQAGGYAACHMRTHYSTTACTKIFLELVT
jgi:glycosyltransferase involved in cell wall biosynthesis